MKFSNFIKVLPLLSTLLLIILLNISNQKENTKLRILIWDTPSLKVGTYLAISTGTGFILSYLITSNLSAIFEIKRKESLKYIEEDKYIRNNEYNQEKQYSTYNNILIERDIKDPSPTINANFRLIKKRESSNVDFINNDSQFNDPIEFDDQFDDSLDKNVPFNQSKSITRDWDDESYSVW